MAAGNVLGRPHYQRDLYYAVVGIHTAISRDRQVSFQLIDGGGWGLPPVAYVTDPVALCVDRYYYLVAYDALRQDYRHYRVDRMADLTVLDSPRSPLPRDFDLGRYVRKIFDMYGGASVTVRLRLHRSLINPAMDRFGRRPHPAGRAGPCRPHRPGGGRPHLLWLAVPVRGQGRASLPCRRPPGLYGLLPPGTGTV